MNSYPIVNIGQQGGAPDISPYSIQEPLAHTAYGMRYYKGHMTASTQGFKLSWEWGPGGSAQSDSVLAAVIFKGSLYVVRERGAGDLNSIYRVDNDGIAHWLEDWGYNYTGIPPDWLIINQHLMLHYDTGMQGHIYATALPDGTVDNTVHLYDFPYSFAKNGNEWVRRSLLVFKNLFVAIDPNRPIDDWAKPNTFIWSDLIPYTLLEGGPTWDAKLGTLAGETILNPAHGDLVCQASMGDRHVVYSNNAAWVVEYVGGDQILSNDDIFTHEGALDRYAACEIPDARHAVMGSNNFYIHNGVQQRYPGERRINRFMQQQEGGIRGAEVVYNTTNHDVVIVTNKGAGLMYFYNDRQDAWSWVKTSDFLPGVTRINKAETTATDSIEVAEDGTHLFESLNPSLWEMGEHKSKVTLYCTDQGVFVDPYSTANPYQETNVVPFELALPYMDLSHITQQPNAYKHHWLHQIRAQMRNDGTVRWEARMYNEFPATVGGDNTISDANFESRHEGVIGNGSSTLMNIDAPGRYITLKFFAPRTSDTGLFSIDGLTAEITPNTYQY